MLSLVSTERIERSHTRRITIATNRVFTASRVSSFFPHSAISDYFGHPFRLIADMVRADKNRKRVTGRPGLEVCVSRFSRSKYPFSAMPLSGRAPECLISTTPLQSASSEPRSVVITHSRQATLGGDTPIRTETN